MFKVLTQKWAALNLNTNMQNLNTTTHTLVHTHTHTHVHISFRICFQRIKYPFKLQQW